MKKGTTSSDPWAVGWLVRVLVLFAFFAAFAVPMGWLKIIAVASEGELASAQVSGPIVIPLGTLQPTATVTVFTPTPHVPRIGIIAGHSASDSGAVCPDGLQEVDVNLDIARRVVALLVQRGWTADLLDEFDVRLNGYQADALLSVHADSCGVPNKSGFKLARAESGWVPEATDVLVDCVKRYYAGRTGLTFDPYTITYDMTRYHAYYEIDRTTPAAIIEMGFLLDDREILTQRPDVVAQGIVDGIICFVEGETP